MTCDRLHLKGLATTTITGGQSIGCVLVMGPTREQIAGRTTAQRDERREEIKMRPIGWP